KNASIEALPPEHRFAFDIADIAEVWRRGSVIPSWLLDLTSSALAENQTLDCYSGFVEDSGEGRWTVNAAIDEAVPAEVLTAALYNLAASDLLPDRFCLVGVARKGMTSDRLRDSLLKGLRQFATQPVDDVIAQRLLSCLTCIEADPKDPASFDAMSKQLGELEAARNTGGNRLFYL